MQLKTLSLGHLTATENPVKFFSTSDSFFSKMLYRYKNPFNLRQLLFHLEGRAAATFTALQLNTLAQHDLLLMIATSLQHTLHLLKQLQATLFLNRRVKLDINVQKGIN